MVQTNGSPTSIQNVKMVFCFYSTPRPTLFRVPALRWPCYCTVALPLGRGTWVASCVASIHSNLSSSTQLSLLLGLPIDVVLEHREHFRFSSQLDWVLRVGVGGVGGVGRVQGR